MHALDTASFGVRVLAGAGAAGLTWLLATDLGSAVVRRLLPESRAQTLLGAALGYALIGMACGALAIVHAVDVRVFCLLFALALLARCRTYLRWLRNMPQRASEAWTRARGADMLSKFALAATALGFIIAFCAGALPAVWWDPIAYHLPVVALGLAHKTLSFDAGMTQTGFPLLAESAALPAYAFAGTAGAALATLGAGIVLALLCGELAETVAAGAGVLATALVSTSALWLWLAPSFYVDVPFALFALAALAAPFLARTSLPNVSLGLLCGAFAGAAAATKYPGLFVACVALALLLMVSTRRAAQIATFALGFCLVALGWYLRSFVLTGDPIYPFLSSVLAHANAAQASQSNQNVVQWFHGVTPHFCGGGISVVDFVLLPWRMLTAPKMYCGDPGYALRLGIVLFALGPLVFRRLRPFALTTVALTCFWFITAQQWRFLVAAVCLFAVVVAATTMMIGRRSGQLLGAILVALGIVGALAQVVPLMIADASNSLVPAARYMAGRESGPDYLRHRLESYAASEWLAKRDPDAGVFALDDVRDYYFGTNVAWGNSPYPGGWRLNWSDSPQARYRKLAASGYRYMVVNDNPAYTHRTVTDVDWRVIEGDERAAVLTKVFSQNDVTVYHINSGE